MDNTATGSTLRANRLEVLDQLLSSSTRLYANPQALENPKKREAIERLVLLLSSVIEARKRVMIEVNVASRFLERVVAVLPAMRQPTISPLHGESDGESGYAIKAAVSRDILPRLIPDLKAAGGTDVVVYSLSQIVA